MPKTVEGIMNVNAIANVATKRSFNFLTSLTVKWNYCTQALINFGKKKKYEANLWNF